ncbi:MAG: alpha-glucan family phosphorylase [Gemmatimonadetes bacterium]|nr:alpha-glucan family phosphorylase [Gemmatimonadota bacterium]
MAPNFAFLPPRIAGLAGIALNVSWSWNREARALFRSIDEQLWVRCRHDPIQLLQRTSVERLAQCATDPSFIARYDAVVSWQTAEQSTDVTWFAQHYPALREGPIAYFCAEFGVYHTVPIYSGGLGVLAGDHCKTASDLGVPLVGVGLLYRAGFFDQRIRPDGWQEDSEDPLELENTMLEPVSGVNGQQWLASVRTDGRDVYIRVWRLRVGRVTIYLLDSKLDENHPDDRGLLSRLYAGGPELRLKQEWLLGVGGVRVLRALGVEPKAWHANEGHAAFMFIERLRTLVAAGRTYADAIAMVRATSTFTTHTPVPAGHDVFPAERVAQVTGPVWDEMGIDRATFMALGHEPTAHNGAFHMTVAAIRLSRHVNAVALTHEVVTRRIWTRLWPERPLDQVPIGHVTNGVHLATWMANKVMNLLDRHVGPDWPLRVDDPSMWDHLLDLDDRELWRVHVSLKNTLLRHVREHARYAYSRRTREVSELAGTGILLDPSALTLGFARRFATYKRANLMFHDVERLLRLLTDTSRPVQVVFAGKAHPADDPGKRVLQEIYHATRDTRFEGRIAFVEDYDVHLAHVLVQGVDCWLNLPRVPMEASGTSGMKAALNGVPQISTIDGWWAEGYDGQNGWAIATPATGDDGPDADHAVASQFYDLLEREVVPAYYDQDRNGVSTRWTKVMKHALRVAGRQFTSRRMLTEYVKDYYVPSMEGATTRDDPPTA